jgi:predicted GNAT superfamily acetyltransferase
MSEWIIRILETPEEMEAVEDLQRLVWPGSETDIIPAHMLLAAGHNGGLVLGAFIKDTLVGMVFGFPGIVTTPAGSILKHHSHILGVLPQWSGKGIGFSLKRAQWQFVRKQGIDQMTWTYDPLLSRNAHLNIAYLGAVCSTYLRSEYGEMRDELNAGIPSDRFQVDWWLRTARVERRLSRVSRSALSLEQYLDAAAILFEASPGYQSKLIPPGKNRTMLGKLLLYEIPTDFPALKILDMDLARNWRACSREFFEDAFADGYLVTDFINDLARTFYVLTYKDAVFQEDRPAG